MSRDQVFISWKVLTEVKEFSSTVFQSVRRFFKELLFQWPVDGLTDSIVVSLYETARLLPLGELQKEQEPNDTFSDLARLVLTTSCSGPSLKPWVYTKNCSRFLCLGLKRQEDFRSVGQLMAGSRIQVYPRWLREQSWQVLVETQSFCLKLLIVNWD